MSGKKENPHAAEFFETNLATNISPSPKGLMGRDGNKVRRMRRNFFAYVATQISFCVAI